MNLIFLLTLLNIIRITSSYNCLREPKNYPCPQNSYCNNQEYLLTIHFIMEIIVNLFFQAQIVLILLHRDIINQYLGLIFGFTFTLPLW